ncbi:MAG TPA: SMI1/KNR4 family protein [Gemmatimonadales bacterium]
MNEHDWKPWLREWNRVLLASYDPAKYSAFVDPELVTPERLASGRLGAPGATGEQLAALEARLGRRLPPSYRSFLQASNGFLQPGLIVPRVLPSEEVDWYRARHQDVIDVWTEALREPGGTEAPDTFERHLSSCLQVSEVERIGSAVYLLNPEVVDAAGEWEAFYFAHWVPGANRYPSFRALMEEELKRLTS